jgi:hypothetical protein
VAATATNPPPNTHSPSRNRGSDDDQHDVVGPDQEDSRHGQPRAVSAPALKDGTTTGAGPSVRVPLPREGDAQQEGTVERSQTTVRRTKDRRQSGSSVDAGTDAQTDSRGSAQADQVSATLTAGPDGAVWVTVEGADVAQLAARISAVCDVLNRTRPPR